MERKFQMGQRSTKGSGGSILPHSLNPHRSIHFVNRGLVGESLDKSFAALSGASSLLWVLDVLRVHTFGQSEKGHRKT